MSETVTVRDIYNAALAIMDESDEADYESRTPGIVNTLLGRCWMASEDHEYGGHSMWTPVAFLDDEVKGIDQSIALSAMPYGLAAQLYLGEDHIRAGAWWDIFQEQLELFRRARPAGPRPIRDEYGGIGVNDFGRW